MNDPANGPPSPGPAAAGSTAAQDALRIRANVRARAAEGHPWVFGNELEAPPPPEWDGRAVPCLDRRGRFLGMGVCNSRSQIVWRRFTRERLDFDGAFLRGALAAAINRRRALGSFFSEFRRLVWSESDDLPGVIVDQYGPGALVLQTQTLAADRSKELLCSLLQEQFAGAEIIVRDDAPVRRLEGLESAVSTLSGRPWEPRWMTVDGLDYWIDLQAGQKTGFYLDQRGEHAKVAGWVARLRAQNERVRVLDACCNQGPFALQAARAGAGEVLGMDISAEAVAQAGRNAGRNGFTAVRFEEGNLFDYFAGLPPETRWDLIVLDPPPFARSRSALEGAMRGYKELNLRAMKHLSPGGILATYSCSHHVTAALFSGMLAAAAHDVRRKVQVLEFSHQPPDHPVLVNMPESEYLRGMVLLVE